MAYRFYLEVFNDDGQKVYDEQILGNNMCFSEDELKKLGVILNEEGLIYSDDAQIVDLKVLLDVFENHYRNHVFQGTILEMTGSEILLEGMFMTIPTYTHVGHYAIIHDALFRLSCKDKLVAKVYFS